MPRDGYLSASQFSAAIGINPYQSRAEAWRLITGRKTFDGNDATRHGNECEPIAVAAYEAHTGQIVTDQQRWFEREYFGTHIDGLAGQTITEFKCPVAGLYDDVPPYYMAQIQGQMGIVLVTDCHFVAWTPDEMRIWRVEFSLDYWNWMRPLLDEFWNCVQKDIEPGRLKRRPQPVAVKTERIA
jgi:putative phage-type endonuclease